MSEEALLIEMDCAKCGRPADRTLCDRCAPPAPAAAIEAAVDAYLATPMGVADLAVSVEEIAPVGLGSALGATPHDFTGIVAEAFANAAVQGAGSLAGGQLGIAGFTSREGYITAIRNGVPARTHRLYLETLRSRYGMTTADIATLNLPGPMAETALPNGAGIAHVPTGPSIFDRPRSERAFIVGNVPVTGGDTPPQVALKNGELIAGAMEGTGALVGWTGKHSMDRAAIVKALDGIPRVLPPRAASAKAHAGQVMSRLTREGFVVRVARGQATTKGVSKWTVGTVNHASTVGASLGQTTMTVTLTAAGELQIDGEASLANKIQVDYQALVAAERYQAGDITSWLSGALRYYFDAVRFGALGYYVPARHVEAAGALCKAIADAGFGADWVLPALPVATSDQLRDGIVRGLTSEVDDLMARLATERATAKAARETAIENARRPTGGAAMEAALKLSGDIGPKRGQTFLVDLRAIGARIVAYGQVLGEERLASAKEQVRQAVVELETVLGDDYSGISARFAGVWDEIELDRKRSGGVL